jgi:HD superfamily phosphohydrolase YqeK
MKSTRIDNPEIADMLEESRNFEGVDELRKLFDGGRVAMNACMEAALKAMIEHLQSRGGEIYPLTLRAYEFMKNQVKNQGE